MFILYTSPTCYFCNSVKEFAISNNIKLEYRDISDPENMKTLLSKGGKMQVPFFVDDENNVQIYESQDIIEYLENYKG